MNTYGTYKFEGIWRPSEKILKQDYDTNNNVIQYPNIYYDLEQVQDKFTFLNTLTKLEKYLIMNNNYIQLPTYKLSGTYKGSLSCIYKDICLFNNNISTMLFFINNVYWDNGLQHYIYYHNIKPSDEFIKFVNKIHIDKNYNNKILSIPSISIIKYDTQYLKLSANQILIMDALMNHGSYTKKYIDNKEYRYSEHAGLLDFNNDGLEKVIISSKPPRIDDGDDTIYLPENIADAYDYEYFFHTHPATPRVGGRVMEGILYEFPSISDIYHFIEHYNNGIVQGSIVIAPEGMYIIRKHIMDNNKIIIYNKQKLSKYIDSVQEVAIKKYGTTFGTYQFYSKVAQDTSFIDKINKYIQKFNLHIDYYARKRGSNGQWTINSIYLPVQVIEPKIN